MTGDAIIIYGGKTLVMHNATLTMGAPPIEVSLSRNGPRGLDLSGLTNEKLEEASELMDAIHARWLEESVEAFWKAHPKGGTFFHLSDGSVAFKDAESC